MNFTQSTHTSSESEPPLHNFMPMSSSSIHVDHDQNMQIFWRERLSEISEAPIDVRTSNILPLVRIRKVMKSDGKVAMISADTPVLVAKACEIFVMELTLRAWMHTQENKRKTVQRNDITDAIRDENLLDFLNDTVPMEPHRHQEHNLTISNNHEEVYVPLPVQDVQDVPVMLPNYSMYLQSMANESEVVSAGGHPVVADDRHFPFPMNLHDNFNHDFLSRNRGTQHNPNFPPPSSFDDGANLYLSYKVWPEAI
ncbi:hypothetical protein C2S52_007976 [Perilla frutescens var. hirtella]|nr:hypothetical protein C2S52_007976 [Perilla frutescens var. hirtella]